MKKIVIIGASGHGKVVASIAKLNGYDDIVFLDDNDSLTNCAGYPVVGNSNSYADYDCDIFVAIGDPNVREMMFNQLEKAGKNIPTLIHPFTSVCDNVKLGKGTVVVAGAVINSCAVIGKGCIINSCSSVDHDCVVSDFVHVSVGAHVSGTVKIGKRTWISAGATVINNVDICDDCVVGAGAVVIKDIIESGTYVGVPCQKINENSDSSKL